MSSFLLQILRLSPNLSPSLPFSPLLWAYLNKTTIAILGHVITEPTIRLDMIILTIVSKTIIDLGSDKSWFLSILHAKNQEYIQVVVH